jgi:hypothetical protein
MPVSVALTHVGSSSWATPLDSTTITLTYPTGLADATSTQTDVVYAILRIKPDTATLNTPTDWTLVGSAAGGGDAQGIGTGPTRTHLYRRTATAALSGTTQAWTITGGSAPIGFMRAYRASGASVAFATETLAFWSVNPGGTAIGGTADAGLDVATLDEINCVIGTADDASTTLTLTGLTATGATLGTLTRDPDVTAVNPQGNDISGAAYRIAVTAGSSNVAPVATATSNTAETAMGFLFRVRATADINTGELGGSLPALAGALTGGVSSSGAIAGSLPALTGALTAVSTIAGELGGALPALTGTLQVTLGTAPPASGVIAGQLPALIGGFSGRVMDYGGGWHDLQSILASARLQQRQLIGESGTECPNDGTALQTGPRGVLHCPFDGWTGSAADAVAASSAPIGGYGAYGYGAGGYGR